MSEQATASLPSTPAAVAAVAQTRVGAPGPTASDADAARRAAEAEGFTIGPGVTRAARGLPYERRPGDPIYRPLWIYTIDPAASRFDGATTIINVPYEPLEPGPRGALFQVDCVDETVGVRYAQLDPEAPDVLLGSGRPPSPADPRFHQQMVYAVCSTVYAAFRTALGRHVAWGFDRPDGRDDPAAPGPRLVLRPHGGVARNAWYDREAGALSFGYFPAGADVAGRNVPGGTVFTCLSHDIVAHEVTHALVDGLRSHLHLATSADVPGFHEGLADTIAILQRFSYREVVRAALTRVRGSLGHATALVDLARQFGETTGTGRSMRTALDFDADGRVVPRRYVPDAEAHAMGEVLVSAVFDAFMTVLRRKTARYLRLATDGTGVLPPHEMSADLLDVLAEEASQLASQFLSICIRAIDYCPPIDLELGEYLRAVISADLELVPDDRWGYREAWMDAFARHRIYPPQVRSLTEDELRWRAPAPLIDPEPELGFGKLQFRGDPACAAGEGELLRQAGALGRIVVRHPAQFGLARPGDPALRGDAVDLPCVQSIRSSRRVGPGGQVVFDLVAEVTQRRLVRHDGLHFEAYGGATIIIGPNGDVRFVIAKNLLNTRRLERQRDFISRGGAAYWVADADGTRVPRRNTLRHLHEQSGPRAP